jgi:hypothetical protein
VVESKAQSFIQQTRKEIEVVPVWKENKGRCTRSGREKDLRIRSMDVEGKGRNGDA